MKIRILLYTLTLITCIQAKAETIYYCSSQDLLECFNITKKQCTQASDKAIELCSDKYGLTLKTHEENEELYKNKANCAGNRFILLASISKNEIKTCKSLLIEATNKEISRVKLLAN